MDFSPRSVEIAEGETVRIGRDAANDVVLHSPIVSRRHAVLERRGGRLVIRDLGSTNGTYVNGVRIAEQVLREGDSVRIGPFRLVLRGERVWKYDISRHAELRGYHLTRDVGGRRILDDVSMAALPGEVTAIAGVSGAGKSTLLSALNGLVPPQVGTVLINEESLYHSYASLQPLFGYVPQADIVHRELPLASALRSAARLRLPLDTSDGEINARVDETLQQLELIAHKEQQIRKLSGGQQKRASLAIELIAQPPILLLDEPTTGLDPGLRRQLMQLLLSLARQGRTVLLVTHDPDSLAYCDQLVFMASGGRVAYMGPTASALEYFEARDFIDVYERVERQNTAEDWKLRFQSSALYKQYREQRLPDLQPVQSLAITPTPRQKLVPDVNTPEQRQVARHQVQVLSRRYVEVLMNDRRNLALLLMQAPLLSLVLSIVSGRGDLTAADTSGQANRLLLLLATSAIWLGTINAVREIVKELPVFVREQLMGVSPFAYLSSKVIVLSGLSLIQAAMLLGVLGLDVDLPSDGVILPGPVEMYLTLALASLAAMAMGLLLSAVSASQERATTLVPLVLIPQIVFAGVIFELVGAADALSLMSLGRWAVELLGATCGVPGDSYSRTVGHQLLRWGILFGFFLATGASTLWVLSRKGGNDLARA